MPCQQLHHPRRRHPRRANLLISQANPYDAGDDEVRIRYWIDNASDVMATGVELSFGKRDGAIRDSVEATPDLEAKETCRKAGSAS